MSDTANWIRLAKLESPVKAAALIERFGSPSEVFRAGSEILSGSVRMTPAFAEKIRRLAGDPVDSELETLDRLGVSVISFQDPEYPSNLMKIADPPAVLFVRGSLSERDRHAIGIVGTRKASEYGRSMAVKIARDLSGHGVCVVSGGARGIDTAAHSGVLKAGGRTIAVLGCGLDVPYPPENRRLFDQIAESGAVISEFAPGTRPDAWRFPVRNRVISGLSLGVLVVESQSKGGAMITATLAGEQGRDVWALPGPTDSGASIGPNRLIRDGAKLVTSAEDILADLGVEIEETVSETLPDLTPEQTAVIGVLTLHPKQIDDIILECELSPSAAGSALTMLEMMGLVRRVPGNSYVRSV